MSLHIERKGLAKKDQEASSEALLKANKLLAKANKKGARVTVVIRESGEHIELFEPGKGLEIIRVED